jgi:hypothetical protein
MRQLGVPLCKAQNRCMNWPKALPTGTCSRNLVSKKAHLLDDRDLLPEWDAAATRYASGAPDPPKDVPCASVSVQTWRTADARTLARKHGAKSFEPVGDIPEIAEIVLWTRPTWTFHCEDAARAIDAMPNLLCDPNVASAWICSAAN